MRKYESTWVITVAEREDTVLRNIIDYYVIRIKARSKAAAIEKLKDVMEGKVYSIEFIGR